MTVRFFVDTNVLLYAATGRFDEPGKHTRAYELLDEGDFGVSTQVLQEFFVNVVRKSSLPLTVEQALEWVDWLATFPCVTTDVELVKAAVSISERFRISYWDAAIIAAAERLEAPVLLTEDLNHGQVYGSVRVENPFEAE